MPIPNNCPRCFKIFDSNHVTDIEKNLGSALCIACNAMYYNYSGSDQFVIMNFFKQNYNLFWYFEKQYCAYINTKTYEAINLEWLPFDITLDRFKILLTFA